MVRQQHRLGRLEMGVSGQNGPLIGRGQVDQEDGSRAAAGGEDREEG